MIRVNFILPGKRWAFSAPGASAKAGFLGTLKALFVRDRVPAAK